MIKGGAGLAVFLVLASTAQASFAPITSPVPKLRGGGAYVANVATQSLKRSPIPRLRSSKAGVGTRQGDQEITTLVQIAELQHQKEVFRKAATTSSRVSIGLPALKRSPIPRARPGNLTQKRTTQRIIARATIPQKPKRRLRLFKSRKGSVCGVKTIKGTKIRRIRDRGGCGIANPVKVTEVAGVALTRELTVNCTAAKQLDKWVARSAKPVIGRKGGGLASIQIIGGYSCRTRNSKRGTKLSEHAKGNAVDIAGFKLRDGTIYSVKRDWRRGRGRKTLRRLHKSACGPFGTVLGPNADRHHQDHFHLDVARHRGGTYCR